MFKKEIYFERYLGCMIVIKLNEDCYVQPKAILILQKELTLASGAPAGVRAEWEATQGEEANPFARMLLPGIKVVLADQRDLMLHFGSEAARDKRLAELVEQWKEG